MLARAAADPWLSCGSTLVFCSSASESERVHRLLSDTLASPPRSVLLHDLLPAEVRASAVERLLAGEVEMLVATQVAARGLDFPSLRHVIMCASHAWHACMAFMQAHRGPSRHLYSNPHACCALSPRRLPRHTPSAHALCCLRSTPIETSVALRYDLSLDVTSFVHCAGRTARRGQAGVVTCLVKSQDSKAYAHRSHHALRPAPRLNFDARGQPKPAAAPGEPTS